MNSKGLLYPHRVRKALYQDRKKNFSSHVSHMAVIAPQKINKLDSVGRQSPVLKKQTIILLRLFQALKIFLSVIFFPIAKLKRFLK